MSRSSEVELEGKRTLRISDREVELSVEVRRSGLLTESAHIRSLANDAVFHRIEELEACRVDGQVEHFAQRIEFEYVVVVPGTSGRARTKVGAAAVVVFVTLASSAPYH
jgi:hypothetical protein